jgi:hypothetical protein
MLAAMVFMLAVSGCGTMGQTGPGSATAQGVPWYQDIENWTPYQKANFFMDTWEAQLADYKAQNGIPNKSPELIKMLKVKQQVLEQSRLPVRAYVFAVQAGTPVQNEQEIVAWLRQLQTLMLQFVK